MKKLTIIRFRLGSVSFLELFHRSERTKLTNKFGWLKFIVGFWYFSHIRQLSCSQNYTFAHLQVKSGTTHQDQAVQTKILLNRLHIVVPTGCCASRLQSTHCRLCPRTRPRRSLCSTPLSCLQLRLAAMASRTWGLLTLSLSLLLLNGRMFSHGHSASKVSWNRAFDELARRWLPILAEFEPAGVDVCFDLHADEDFYDGVTFERFLKLVNHHPTSRQDLAWA